MSAAPPVFSGGASGRPPAGGPGSRCRGLALAIVIGAAVPTGLSYVTGIAGIWDGSNVTRALLAVPLGLSAGAVVAAVATKDLR